MLIHCRRVETFQLLSRSELVKADANRKVPRYEIVQVVPNCSSSELQQLKSILACRSTFRLRSLLCVLTETRLPGDDNAVMVVVPRNPAQSRTFASVTKLSL